MNRVDLIRAPNQSFTVENKNVRFEVTLQDLGNSMCSTIKKNGVLIQSGMRVISGFPLIPFKYLSSDGNFIFETENGEYPHWKKFGITQELYFYD